MSVQARMLANSVVEQPSAESTKTAVVASPAPVNFDEAFQLHHRAVYRTAYALMRDAALAEDVSQEVFLKLYRQLKTAVPGEELLRAWLLRVTINAAHNALRGRHRSVVREEKFAQEEAHRNDFAPAPDDEYERRTRIETVSRALERITEPTRSCLLLKQQGLSYREIAVVLSIKETNVGSLIARGRKEFLRVYGKIGGGDDVSG
ncbi:MAG: sigma-70 family RNA polymerase sigma factor [Pyrinomonadaceae bacterium]